MGDYFHMVSDETGARLAWAATFNGDWNAARQKARLFLAPGMGHCGGGPGPNEWDKLQPLVEWVEKGKAPASIVSRREDQGKVVMTRPLCPYPQVAKYKGTGDTNDAKSFECAAAK